ncbi:MAG: phosphoglycerate kinase [Methanohalophilus sp. T328-1]|jgi:phosphoglycerate kinase|uniref:Phosphoglycerate kinase n=2 Tax=Methanohalophilus TaxID=2175 RepID=A0A285G6P5_9EURY|nr:MULTISPECIES: phosphoglycerate kinase [Methanohalophilus]KXS45546.1 MAG: phosphoglycerate kinase [Methanohalophilus sp. T328-1]RSD36234.1 MAG: phosphoglycerate kinase [Methanohalophilus sp.]ODV49270.1 MAG: phosphoglycerate kinase [Methanohalophilus sp. 2-GBenrich]RXG34930.1 phosphoglycerate kinase [Methanohalophilus sp. WG1-DM]TCL12422.1 phosphoglycerate kinase [Methanohalophilus euhalobius]
MDTVQDKDYFTIDDFDVDDKTILVRVDINTPMDPEGSILDDLRISSHIPTIKDLEDSRVVLLAHQSRAGKSDFTTMQPHAKRLSHYLGREVEYVDDIFGSHARSRIAAMEKGDVLLLENVRFYSEETISRSAKEHASTHMVKNLAPLADIFLNDAFAVSHRSHLSLMGFTHLLPCGAGRLMEKEITSLDMGIKGGGRPCIFVLGGAKVDDSLKVAENVLSNGGADRVLVTGVVANVMLAASGFDIGKANKDFIESQGYLEQIDRAKKILDDFDGKVGLPIDVALNDNGSRIEVSVEEVGDSVLPINDIGIETIVAYSREISQAGTVILNGPAGVSEQDGFELGTYEIVKAATEADYSIAGGGHISAEVRNMGFDHSLSHISTGGGSCIDYLAGTPLPAIEALKKAAVIISKHD